MLGPGGRLLLGDVVFPDKAEADPCGHFEELVAAMPENSRAEMTRHIRQEFSTSDRAMRELLVRAGFILERAEVEGFPAQYLCRKP